MGIVIDNFMITHPQIVGDRELLNEGLRERGYFPHAPHPADIFIAETAGLDISRVPIESSIGRTGCWYFVVIEDRDTHKMVKVSENGESLRYWHEYDDHALETIDKYWHLLSKQSKFEE